MIPNKINFTLFNIFFLVVLAIGSVSGQTRSLDVGLRFQKTLNLYYENGVTLQYASPRILHNRLAIGLNYVSSRLGSAIGSNALKQDNYFLSGTYLFRPKRKVNTFLRANAGYFRANYESDIFRNLDNSSPLLSGEFGLAVPLKSQLKSNFSLGYNLITGNGTNNPGTLYPVFYQFSLTWNILKPVAK